MQTLLCAFWTGDGLLSGVNVSSSVVCPPLATILKLWRSILIWLITDGWQMLHWGEEGVDFENRDGLYVDLLTADQRAAKLAYTGEYGIVAPYGMSAELYLKAAEASADDEKKEARIIDAKAVMGTKDIKFRRDTPTGYLGVALVIDYMTDMNTYASEKWAKALADADYTAEQALEDIKAEWNNMDYEMVKEAFNEKQKNLGYKS